MQLTAEMLAKLRVCRTQGVGPVTFRRAMQRYGSAERAVENWAEISPKTQLCDAALVTREVEALQRAGGWMVFHGEADYPSQLGELPDAPIAVSGLGDVKFLHARQVAVVGNRSASATGLAWGKALAAELARAGVVVTSGLARGIDTAAHDGALTEGGATVAVVAGGVDNIYPPENARLRERIIQNGCVVSEQAWGMVPTASLFPRRNRIIAGLSIGVVVSEATRHSGSLITAECALNYGREVWAVPGSPSDPRSGGPNWLLKNGATLIEGAADVLAGLPARPAPFVVRAAQADLFSSAAPVRAEIVVEDDASAEPVGLRQRLFSLLGGVPVSFDELVRQMGVNEADMSGLLIELELDGHAQREADGRWRRG